MGRRAGLAVAPGAAAFPGVRVTADPVPPPRAGTVVPGRPGAWILSSQAISPAGQPVSTLPAACAGAGPKAPDPGQCLESQGYREAIAYEPASRYWPLQWIETGIFLALALALAGFCFWRLGRGRT